MTYKKRDRYLNTKDDSKKIKKEILKNKSNLKNIAKSLKISPSKRRILQLPKELLLKHNALVFHDVSPLSFAQRKMVVERIEYALQKGTIKVEEVASENNKINFLIQNELKKKKDDSIINE